MSKIDVLIIVHSEHEGLFSVGNGERARCRIIWSRASRLLGYNRARTLAVICRKGDTGSSGDINNILLLMFLNTIS